MIIKFLHKTTDDWYPIIKSDYQCEEFEVYK